MTDKTGGNSAQAGQKEGAGANQATKQPKTRSPNYPYINLESAIAKLDEAFSQMKRHAVGVAIAVSAMKLSYNSSSGKLTLAAMRAFGLFENASAGLVKVSTLGLDIASDYKRGSPEWWKAVKQAALGPKIHQTLWEKYGPDLPPDEELRRFLIRDMKFGDNAVASLIAEYKATIAFASLASEDKMEVQNDNQDDQCGGDAPPQGPPPVKRGRQMATGMKEDVYSLDEGAVVLQWPERISKASAQDLEDWLALIIRKAKRVADATDPNDCQHAE